MEHRFDGWRIIPNNVVLCSCGWEGSDVDSRTTQMRNLNMHIKDWRQIGDS